MFESWIFLPPVDTRTGALVGYDVVALDGGAGSVVDTLPGCVVVDTGPWVFGREVVLPDRVVSRVDHERRVVHIDRTKKQIRHWPASDGNCCGTADQ